jgi:hypothetical protein
MRSLACLVLLGLTSTAYADGEKSQTCEPKVELSKERRGDRDVWVAKMKICVHAPAPGVAFVPVSKSINYEWEELRQVFLPRTVHSVEKAPF